MIKISGKVTNYQCPACTGPLHFSAESGMLECDHCGSKFTPEQVEEFYAGMDKKAADVFNKAAKGETTIKEGSQSDIKSEFEYTQDQKKQHEEYKKTSWDGSTISADWGEDSEHMRAYSCPSCGAQIMCDDTTAATQCPYCGNPSIIPGQFAGALRPDFIIPFKYEKKQAEEAFRAHYRGKLFLPSKFKSGNEIKKIQGIYVPFWLFSGNVDANALFEGLITTTHRRGDYEIITTQHFNVERAGNIAFDRVPADASAKMPDKLMDSLEPYDYGGLKKFSVAYMPGYLADKFDVSAQDNAQRVDARCKKTARDVLRADVHGYMSVIERHSDVFINRGAVNYALLPVWIMKTKWDNKDYLFAMNGQTGKFVGDLPVSKGRFMLFALILTVGLSLLFYFIGVGDFLAQLVMFFAD